MTKQAIAVEQVSWLDRVRMLGPMIDAAAAANEQATELTPEVVQALDDAGIFSMSSPRELGGGEAHPTEIIDVLSELSYWDGSTGWYCMVVMSSGSFAGACLGPKAVAAMFAGGKYQRAAGQSAPGGKAERVGDGYRCAGRFTFGTGTRHSQWIHGGFVLHEGGKPVIGANGKPVILCNFVPRETVRFHGNWNVIGLRGTGSYDFEICEQVLHEDFFFVWDASVPQRGGPLYRMGFRAQPCMSTGAVALGIGRRIVDEWRIYAHSKRRGAGSLADLPTFHRDIAVAAAELRAAEAYIKQAYCRLFDAAASDSITEEMKLDGRLCASYAVSAAVRVAQAAYASCTTHALRNGNPIQRGFRDIHAASAHILTGENSFIDAGKAIADGAGSKIAF